MRRLPHRVGARLRRWVSWALVIQLLLANWPFLRPGSAPAVQAANSGEAAAATAADLKQALKPTQAVTSTVYLPVLLQEATALSTGPVLTPTQAVSAALYLPVVMRDGRGDAAAALDFSAHPLNGATPLTVTFHHVAGSDYSNFAWSHGDSAPAYTSPPGVFSHTHVYTRPGAYTVTLTADGPNGNEQVLKPNYIVAVDEAEVVTATIPITGGTLDAPDSGVLVEFPAGAVTETVIVTYTEIITTHTGQLIPPIKLFSLEAVAAANPLQPVQTFSRPVRISVAYNQADLGDNSESFLYLFYRGQGQVTWHPIVADSWVVTGTNRLITEVSHFTDFALLSLLGPAPPEGLALPSTSNFGSSEFYGAATVGVPLALPPLPGKLDLSLSLNYSSDTVNSIRSATMTNERYGHDIHHTQAGRYGLGWSLSGLPEIGRGPMGQVVPIPWLQLDEYRPMYFDISSDKGWQTHPVSFIRVQNGLGGCSRWDDWGCLAEFMWQSAPWQVWDQNGTHYIFGETQGYEIGRCDIYFTGYLLTEMRDVYGNRLQISYDKETGPASCRDRQGQKHPTGYDRAVYPRLIEIFPAQAGQPTIRVRFEAAVGRADARLGGGQATPYYADSYVNQIAVEVNINGDWQPYRTYDLMYDYVDSPFPKGEEPDDGVDRGSTQHLLLRRVVPRSHTGQAFPPYSFKYDTDEIEITPLNWNYAKLVEANNGAGGRVRYNYAEQQISCGSGQWVTREVVETMATYDGLGSSPVSTARYSYQPGACRLDGEKGWFFGNDYMTKTLFDGIGRELNRSETWYYTARWYPYVGPLAHPLMGHPFRSRTWVKGQVRQETGVAWQAERMVTIPQLAHLDIGLDWITKVAESETWDGQTKTKTYAYDKTGWPFNYGYPTQIIANNREQTDIRYTHNAFHQPPFIRGLQQEVWVRDRQSGELLRHKQFVYDEGLAKGELQTEIAFTGDSQVYTGYSYDAWGNPTRITDPNGHWVQTGYDPVFHTYPVRQTNEYWTQAAYEYNFQTGQVIRETKPNGHWLNYSYDDYGRLTRVLQSDDGGAPSLRYSYRWAEVDGAGRIVSPFRVTAEQRDDDGYLTGRYFYNGLGQLIQVQGESDQAGQMLVLNRQYGALGQVAKENYPVQLVDSGGNYVGNLPAVDEIEYEYDGLGRPLTARYPDGRKLSMQYNGWTQTVIDENGQRQDQVSDAFDRLVEVREYDGDSVYAATHYTYNAAGELVQVTGPAGHATVMGYDRLGRKVSMHDPDMGQWRYGYDPAGNLLWQEDARGIRTGMTYDALNRLTGKSYSNGQPSVTYTYDQNGDTGSRTGMQDGVGTVSWDYDSRGRLIETTRHFNNAYAALDPTGAGLTLGYSYDPAGRLRATTYPDGEVVIQDYTARGLPERLLTSLAPGAYVTGAAYDEQGRLTELSLGNGVQTRYDYYNPAERANQVGQGGRLKTLRVQRGSSLLDLSYTYDAVGNIKTIDDALLWQQAAFDYDHLDRLTHAIAAPGAIEGFEHTYRYDPTGNLIERDGQRYDYHPAHRPHAVTQVGDNTYQYDANGNMIERVEAGITYQQDWTAENKLARATWREPGQTVDSTVRFVYDGDGQRLLKIENFSPLPGQEPLEVTTLYLGQIYEQQFDTTAANLSQAAVVPASGAGVASVGADDPGDDRRLLIENAKNRRSTGSSLPYFIASTPLLPRPPAKPLERTAPLLAASPPLLATVAAKPPGLAAPLRQPPPVTTTPSYSRVGVAQRSLIVPPIYPSTPQMFLGHAHFLSYSHNAGDLGELTQQIIDGTIYFVKRDEQAGGVAWYTEPDFDGSASGWSANSQTCGGWLSPSLILGPCTTFETGLNEYAFVATNFFRDTFDLRPPQLGYRLDRVLLERLSDNDSIWYINGVELGITAGSSTVDITGQVNPTGNLLGVQTGNKPVLTWPQGEINGTQTAWRVTAQWVYAGSAVPRLDSLPPFTAGAGQVVSWQPVAEIVPEARYEVQMATRPDFNPVAETITTTDLSHTFGGLQDGVTYYFRVRARNSFDQVSDWSEVVSTTRDAAAPQVELLEPGAPYQQQATFTIRWTAGDAGSGLADSNPFLVEITPAGGQPIYRATAETRLDFTGQDGVTYLIRVIARDKVGNEGESQFLTTTVDTGQPVITLPAGPIYFSPNGDGRADTATIEAAINDATPVQWTARIERNGVTYRTRSGSGPVLTWTWDGRDGDGTVVPDGNYTLVVEAGDAAGNSNEKSEAALLRVDTTPPDIAFSESLPDGRTVHTSPVLVTGFREDSFTGVTVEGVAADYPGPNSFAALIELDPGPNEIEVTGLDRAQNQTTIRQTVIYDLDAPRLGDHGPGGPIRQTRPEIWAEFEDGASPGIVAHTVLLDGVTLIPSTPEGFTYQPDTPLSEGEHIVTVNLEDAGGLTSSDGWSFIVDTTAELVLHRPLDGWTTNHSQLAVTGRTEAGATVTLWVNGQEAGSVAAPEGSFEYEVALSEGANEIRAVAADPLGNQAEAMATVTYNPNRPAAEVWAAPAVFAPGSSQNNSTTLGLWAGPGPGAIIADWSLQVLQEGQVIRQWQGSGNPPAGLEWTGQADNGSLVADGLYQIRLSLTDSLGQAATSLPAMVTVDTGAPAAPVITVPAQPVTHQKAAAALVQGTAEANTVLVLAGERFTKTTPVALDGSWSLVFPLESGRNTLSATATDAAGQVSPPSNEVVVWVDVEPPLETVHLEPVYATHGTEIDLTATSRGDDSPAGPATVKVTAVMPDQAQPVSLDKQGPEPLITTWRSRWTVANGVKDGDRVVTFTGVDALGNAGEGQTSLIVDSSRPEAPWITFPREPVWVGQGEITLKGEAGWLDAVTLRANDAPAATTQADASGLAGRGNWAASLSLAEGEHTLRAWATDVAGNVSEPSNTALIRVDLTGPVTGIEVPPASGRQAPVAWSGDDANGSGVIAFEVEYRDGDSGPWLPWLEATPEVQGIFPGLPQHSYYFRVRAIDFVGNIGDWAEAGPVEVKAITKYYTFGAQRVALRQENELYFLHGDHLGSTSLTTGAGGAVIAEARYHPYGRLRWENGLTPTDFAFTGQRLERSFGLMDYNARYYSPVLGRFISPDPIVPEPGGSQGFNRYGYVSNNPLRYIDPTGHFEESDLREWFGDDWRDKFSDDFQYILQEGEFGDAVKYGSDVSQIAVFVQNDQDRLQAWLIGQHAVELTELQAMSDQNSLAFYRPEIANWGGNPSNDYELNKDHSADYKFSEYKRFGLGNGPDSIKLPYGWQRGPNSYIDVFGSVAGINLDFSDITGYGVTGAKTVLESWVAYKAGASIGPAVGKALGGWTAVIQLAIDLESFLVYDTGYVVRSGSIMPPIRVPTPPSQ